MTAIKTVVRESTRRGATARTERATATAPHITATRERDALRRAGRLPKATGDSRHSASEEKK